MTNESQPSASFTAAYLPMLHEFRAWGDIRQNLNGIAIQPDEINGGANLIATNGHRLLVIHDAAAIASGDQIWNIEQSLVDACRRKKSAEIECICPRCDEEFTESTDCDPIIGQTVTVGMISPDIAALNMGDRHSSVIAYGKASSIDAQVIDWKKAMPRFSALKPGTGDVLVDPKYLAAVDAADCVDGRFGVQPMHEPESEVLVFLYPLNPEIVWALMPLRKSTAAIKEPEWLATAYPSVPQTQTDNEKTEDLLKSPTWYERLKNRVQRATLGEAE